jgi:hypothetical protein
VSCPDWRQLTARRRREGSDPAEWAEAMAHFDSCLPCRREALAADPLLVFRRLPAVELGAAEERSEVEAVRQAVSAMRTARRLAARRSFGGWRRWSAAAVLALAALTVSRDKDPQLEMERTVRASLLVPLAQPAPARGMIAPTIDVLNHPDARVYQMNDHGLSVIMVVHESFDV